MAKLENPDAIARLRRTERAKSCRYVSSRTRVPDNDTLVRKRTQEDPIRPSECLPTSTKARGTGPSSDRGRQSSASCGSANPWSRRDVPCSGSHHVVLAPSHDVTSPAERARSCHLDRIIQQCSRQATASHPAHRYLTKRSRQAAPTRGPDQVGATHIPVDRLIRNNRDGRPRRRVRTLLRRWVSLVSRCRMRVARSCS